MFLRKSKAQTVAEYAALIAILAAAIMTMRIYMQRAVQGKAKALVDQINPYQYNPTDTSSVTTTNTTGEGSYNMTGINSYTSGSETSERDWSESSRGDVVE
ncbi:MAG: hypothetical protein PHU91_00750 [Candidatus Omnitrophica bacterium]|nr:hypothetical protein [Candidatus Omnitrophota bacterium]MDD5236188.1 hypothetical protein [Candidatus Omnitrophota bacterium]MDD5610825.1 hypothetical protein [Candidatus Omnitrophota bacterium]